MATEGVIEFMNVITEKLRRKTGLKTFRKDKFLNSSNNNSNVLYKNETCWFLFQLICYL